ncbi:MAG: cupredoxin domain-containing protein [Candidatus Paceibacterota bacterium]
MNNKAGVAIAILVSALILGGIFYWGASRSNSIENNVAAVSIESGTQIITISAKGGYSPRVVEATKGVPTILRMKTNGTFDCSASLVIPKLSYQKFLPSSGTEEIPISAEQAQGTMQGLCSMGMYNFQIRFL